MIRYYPKGGLFPKIENKKPQQEDDKSYELKEIESKQPPIDDKPPARKPF